MRLIHILRKPCSEPSIAQNALKQGCGCINIDASRIGVPFVSAGGNNFDAWRKGEDRTDRPTLHGLSTAKVAPGRWPANLVLQHLPGCIQEGLRQVKSDSHTTYKREIGDGIKYHGGGRLDMDKGNTFADAKGKETGPNWNCQEDCPIADLDTQSGFQVCRPNTYGKVEAKSIGIGYGASSWKNYTDAGGSSRYFKQVK